MTAVVAAPAPVTAVNDVRGPTGTIHLTEQYRPSSGSVISAAVLTQCTIPVKGQLIMVGVTKPISPIPLFFLIFHHCQITL